MKVIHIIPSAFNYFDDIRASAFALVNTLDAAGIETNVFTLQYGTSTAAPEAQEQVEIVAPGRTYAGVTSITQAIDSFVEYDVVHVHTPLLGAAGKIIEWKQEHLDRPLLVTCHRLVVTPDVLSLFIKMYISYYLPKLFRLADVVAAPSLLRFAADYAWSYRRFSEKVLEVDDSPMFIDQDVTYGQTGVELTNEERLAFKYVMVYNEIV